MRKILLISPHFDDAVLSAGQLLAGRPDADIMTIYAGEPEEETSTPYDLKCGFKTSSEAIAKRRHEDINALALLKANPIHLDYPDSQYGEDIDLKELEKMIAAQINSDDYEFILAPLGLGHPDHVIIADLMKKMSFTLKIPVYFWEDMPLRVVEPELVPPRLQKLRLKKLAKIGTGPIADKIRALSCYTSQIGTGILDPYVMYVPERFWK